MKVVTDTNVIIAALLTHGHCEEVLLHVRRYHTMVVSEQIVEEVEMNLRKKFRFTKRETTKVVRLLEKNAIVVPVQMKNVPMLRDKKDAHVLLAAEQIQADVVITGDKDLLSLKRYKKISITHPKDFWEKEFRTIAK